MSRPISGIFDRSHIFEQPAGGLEFEVGWLSAGSEDGDVEC